MDCVYITCMDCVYNIMKRGEEQGVAAMIESYFKQAKQQQQKLKKVLKISQIYGKQGWHVRLVGLMLEIFKKLAVRQEGFSVLCKRLLKIWDQILQAQFKKNQHAFRQAISDIIVESFTFIFPLIFSYRFHDLILDFKLYRMLWAKSITEQAFFALRTQISKNHRNFDLNKGLSQDNIDKIKKRLSEKGATEEEIQKYMAITQLQKKTQPSPSMQKRQQRDSSEDEDSDITKKKLKQDHFYTPNLNNQYNQFPYSNNPYQKPYSIQQPNPYQIRPNTQPPPSYSNSMYPPSNFPRPFQNTYNNIAQGHHYAVVPPNQQYFPQTKIQTYPYDFNTNPQTNYSNYAHQNNFNNYNTPPLSYSTPFNPSMPPQGNVFNSYPNQNITNIKANIPKTPQFITNSKDLKRQSPQFTSKVNKNFTEQQLMGPEMFDSASTLRTDLRPTHQQFSVQKSQRQKYRMILNKLKKGFHECRQCGMNFLSKENLDQHKRQHFLQAHRQFLSKQSQSSGNTQGIQKQKQKVQSNFDLMCDISEWVMQASVQGQGTADYQVSIKRLPSNERIIPVFYCYFCNEELQIIWCCELQQWTLNKGIKVQQRDGGLCVAHIDCYECFRDEEASFNTTSSLSY